MTARLLLAGGLFAIGFLRVAAADSIPLKPEILSTYVKIADALAIDDVVAAKSAAAGLAEKADIANQFQIAKQASAVATAADLSAVRDAFKPLSVSIEPLAADEKGYTVMTCTMANADWVQTSAEVKNPYLGKSMQSCGEPKKNAAPHMSGCDDANKGCGR